MLKMYNASRLIKILNVQEMSFIVRLVAVAIYKLKVGINRRRECAATAHRWILFGSGRPRTREQANLDGGSPDFVVVAPCYSVCSTVCCT